ncbi:E3 ubiquitin-protein ligase RFWD3 [Drosophila takahashii]|uniref:E3 ubiquitin-protein ligase RFWD3 n=1 Tax=Drosophila takahashii TaxID=29030 RepID=UPI001CF8255E|nr:E3 ubiquitin-protein ligase RFWD3 [Drosophila takahashii]
MSKIKDLLVELQRQEKDLEQLNLSDSVENPEARLGQLEFYKAQIKLYNNLREGIQLNLEQETNKLAAAIPKDDRIVEMLSQVNEINGKLDKMYEINNCSICETSCDPSGNHCLVSLRCGHLFGRHCILSALRQVYRCPICLRGALPSHVRKIYGLNSFPF